MAAENVAHLYAFIQREGRKPIPNEVFSIEDGILRVSSVKVGYLARGSQYTNFRLIAEYRWAGPTTETGHGTLCCTLRSFGSTITFLVRLAPSANRAGRTSRRFTITAVPASKGCK